MSRRLASCAPVSPSVLDTLNAAHRDYETARRREAILTGTMAAADEIDAADELRRLGLLTDERGRDER